MTPPSGLVRYAVHLHYLLDAKGHDHESAPFHIVYKAADVEAWANEILILVDQHSKEEALLLMQQSIATLKGEKEGIA